MANVDVEIGGRRYSVACRDGEEAQLLSVAAIVDRKAQEATAALGNLSETRQLLYASLLLADELKERSEGGGGAPAAAAAPAFDPRVEQLLDRLAESAERLAERLEEAAPTP